MNKFTAKLNIATLTKAPRQARRASVNAFLVSLLSGCVLMMLINYALQNGISSADLRGDALLYNILWFVSPEW
jgi:hypothetical protein